jgi:predicted dehydrogenase
MLEVLKLNPKLIIAEKPFCNNYDEAVKISKQYQKANIPIVINYTRRFCPSILEIKSKLETQKYGKIRACNIIYVRGFQRDACHAIDLCNYFFGEFKQGKILGNRNNIYNDFDEKDFTVPVWMEYDKCKNIFLTPANGLDYSIFEMDILTENARINLIDHGKKTKIYFKKSEKVYGDFSSMNYKATKIINNEIELSLISMYRNTLEYFKSKNKNQYNLICTDTNALDVQKVYQKILN